MRLYRLPVIPTILKTQKDLEVNDFVSYVVSAKYHPVDIVRVCSISINIIEDMVVIPKKSVTVII